MPRPIWSTLLVVTHCWSLVATAQESTTPATTTAAPSSVAVSTSATGVSVSATGNVTIDAVFRHWTGCTATEQHAISDALDEARQILNSPGAREFDTKFYNHMNAVEYFGSPRDMKQLNQRGLVQENLNNAYKFASIIFNPQGLGVFCHAGSMPEEPWKSACGSVENPNSIIVANNYYDNGDPAYLFCDRWFRLSPLGDAVHRGLTAPLDFQKFDVGFYENRARPFISAIMMDKRIGVNPQDDQGNTLMRNKKFDFVHFGYHYALNAAQCKLATKDAKRRDDPPSIVFMDNADSYSWYALAAYVSEGGNLNDYPVYPYVPYNGIFATNATHTEGIPNE